jgi:hypothetical protein
MLVSREISRLDPTFKIDIFLAHGDYILNWTERVGRRAKLRAFRNDTFEGAQKMARQMIQEHEAKLGQEQEHNFGQAQEAKPGQEPELDLGPVQEPQAGQDTTESC